MKNKEITLRDPVCGMEVNPQVSKDSLHSTDYNGKEFYFCSPFCTAAFVENPEKFVRRESQNNKLPNKP